MSLLFQYSCDFLFLFDDFYDTIRHGASCRGFLYVEAYDSHSGYTIPCIQRNKHLLDVDGERKLWRKTTESEVN